MKLILFDIDGTLIRSAGAGKDSMEVAFEKIHGIRNGFHTIHMMGRTDPSILKEALENHHLSWSEYEEERFKKLYFETLEKKINEPRDGKRICPEIVPLLKAIQKRKHFVLALLTGNWKTSAFIKLHHFGIDHYFEFGAFADDSSVREDLVPFAVQRYQERYPDSLKSEDVYVVGDTPKDILCARPHGAQTVVVATGFHTADELLKENPDHFFDTFKKTEDVLRVFDS